MIELILIVLLILFLVGGGFGYSRRTDWGNGPVGLIGVLFVIVLVILVLRWL